MGRPGARCPRELEKPFMARIAGVNLPTNKRVIIALQYIHGIATKAKEITDKLSIAAERRVQDLTDQKRLHPRGDRRQLHRRGRPQARDGDEHQAADGPRLLSRPAPSQGPAGPRSAPLPMRAPARAALPIAGKKK